MSIRFIKFLRWSEQYTKTDMVYMFKGGSWLGLGQIISSAAALLLSVAFANFLSKDAFGIYKYVISAVSVLSITTLSGLNTAVTQSVARGFEGLVKKAPYLKMKWGLLGGGISLCAAFYYYLNGNVFLFVSFLIASLFIPIFDSFTIYNSLLQGRKEFGLYTKYNSLKTVATAFSLVGALYFTGNLFIVLAVYFASYALSNYLITKAVLSKIKINDASSEDAIVYGKHLTLLNIVSTITSQLDKILVFQYIGAAELALYAFATAPLDQIKGLFKNINFLAWPKFAEQPAEEIRGALFNKMLRLGLFVSLAAIGYILIALFVYEFIFPQYIESVWYSQIMALGLPAAILMGFPQSFLEAQGAKNHLYKFNIASNIQGILILFVGIYFWGLLGAVVARTLSRFINLFLVSYFASKE